MPKIWAWQYAAASLGVFTPNKLKLNDPNLNADFSTSGEFL